MKDVISVAGAVALVAVLMLLVRGPSGAKLINSVSMAWQRAASATMWPAR